MLPSNRPGRALRLFAFQGIDVYLHWSWFVIFVLELYLRRDAYDAVVFNVLEFLSIFVLVTLHEFGHALACRSVGGTAERIMLWPLGGVAFVRPPPRAGAFLWSIAAGPLVNVVLVPVTIGLALVIGMLIPALPEDMVRLLWTFAFINGALLVFNLLPVYPLDGGQILRSLLWFVIGRERSLLVAAGIGLVVSVLGGVALLLFLQEIWLGILAVFAALQSWNGLKIARARVSILGRPRHQHARCPVCGEAPPMGLGVRCAQGHAFDPFMSDGWCNQCGGKSGPVPCLSCENVRSIREWMTVAPARPSGDLN